MENFVFMIMPFSDQIAEDLYKLSTKKIVNEVGLGIRRADEIFSPNIIYDDIFIAIEKATIVIVDISGLNSNCLYELGISHSIKKSSTIMITRDQYRNAPFDIAHFRILQYSDTIHGKTKYENLLRKTLKSMLSGLPELYRNEFELIINLFTGTDDFHSLLAILALSISNTPIKENLNLLIEGKIPNVDIPMGGIATAKDVLNPFVRQGYVNLAGDNFSLSNIGKNFANYLESKGYEIYAINEKLYKKGYKRIFTKKYKSDKKLQLTRIE